MLKRRIDDNWVEGQLISRSEFIPISINIDIPYQSLSYTHINHYWYYLISIIGSWYPCHDHYHIIITHTHFLSGSGKNVETHINHHPSYHRIHRHITHHLIGFIAISTIIYRYQLLYIILIICSGTGKNVETHINHYHRNPISIIIISFPYQPLSYLFLNTIFVSSHMYPENPEGTPSNRSLYEHGIWYIYDIYPTLPGLELTNLFHHMCTQIPLDHSDGRTHINHHIYVPVFAVSFSQFFKLCFIVERLCKVDAQPAEYTVRCFVSGIF